MVGRADEGEGSSMRSTTRRPSQSKGTQVPEWCGCGKRPMLRWSRTEIHPNKSFFGCPNYNSSGRRWCGFFRWTDIVEDDKGNLEDTVAYNNEEVSVGLALRIGNLEAELRTQKYMIQMLGLLFFSLLVVVLVVMIDFSKIESKLNEQKR
ncbi:hypothetical protein Ahy_B01g052683 [Arachis hypogaea]|uniref:GRF-type domain-containing protein n=1 Tax=Arachis hypogaea TaxID=3818 RepID=A0A445AQ17_ARAHY|nr:hypothetical protein Ahy_B01g052683 [Arachis hypogaea]